MAELASWAVGSDTERIVDVEDARAATSALLAPSATIAGRTGFLAGPTTQGRVTASGTPDANVTVAAFQAALDNSRGQFPYIATLDSPKTIDVLVANPSDPANARWDLIIAQQNDAYYGDANSLFEVKRITGTPAASPSDPAVTGSPAYITLARITVTAGATTITSGMITDLRPTTLTVARGGTIPCTAAARPASPYAGMKIFETDTGIERVWNATTSAWEALFGAVSSVMTTSLPIRTTVANEASLTSTLHGFQIGSTSSANLRADPNEIQAVNNAAAATLNLQPAGGLVQVGTGGLDVDGATTLDGAATVNNTVTITPTPSDASKAVAFNHAYGIFVDNVNAVGGAGTRFWLDTPANGDVTIGPRTGANVIAGLRFRTDSTTASGANMFIDSGTYRVSRSTSSLKYKVDVQDMTLDLDALRALRPVRFRDKGEVRDDPDTTQTYVGLIAEEVDALGLHEFVQYMTNEETGERTADGVQYDRLAVAQQLLIRALEDTVSDQAGQIADLAARVEALESP
jgi:hypothetical protein